MDNKNGIPAENKKKILKIIILCAALFLIVAVVGLIATRSWIFAEKSDAQTLQGERDTFYGYVDQAVAGLEKNRGVSFDSLDVEGIVFSQVIVSDPIKMVSFKYTEKENGQKVTKYYSHYINEDRPMDDNDDKRYESSSEVARTGGGFYTVKIGVEGYSTDTEYNPETTDCVLNINLPDYKIYRRENAKAQ